MGVFVNYFFGGFILGRIPFALSPKFRLMLQRGIDLPSLHPSYFTSLSYYMLLLFGMQGVFRLFFRHARALGGALACLMYAGGSCVHAWVGGRRRAACPCPP